MLFGVNVECGAEFIFVKTLEKVVGVGCDPIAGIKRYELIVLIESRICLVVPFPMTEAQSKSNVCPPSPVSNVLVTITSTPPPPHVCTN